MENGLDMLRHEIETEIDSWLHPGTRRAEPEKWLMALRLMRLLLDDLQLTTREQKLIADILTDPVYQTRITEKNSI